MNDSWIAHNLDEIFMRITSPEDQLRAMFVDGILPEAGDTVEMVVTSIDLAHGLLETKLRVKEWRE